MNQNEISNEWTPEERRQVTLAILDEMYTFKGLATPKQVGKWAFRLTRLMDATAKGLEDNRDFILGDL